MVKFLEDQPERLTLLESFHLFSQVMGLRSIISCEFDVRANAWTDVFQKKSCFEFSGPGQMLRRVMWPFWRFIGDSPLQASALPQLYLPHEKR